MAKKQKPTAAANQRHLNPKAANQRHLNPKAANQRHLNPKAANQRHLYPKAENQRHLNPKAFITDLARRSPASILRKTKNTKCPNYNFFCVRRKHTPYLYLLYAYLPGR